MLRTGHQHQPVVKNALHHQPRGSYRHGDDADIDQTVLQPFENLVAEVAIDADLHIGVAPPIFAESLRQHIEACRFIRADRKNATRSLQLISHRSQRFAAQSQQAVGVLEQNVTGGRQSNALAGTVKQPGAVLLLKLADLRAYSRLRAIDLFACTREVALLHHFEKSRQLIEIHWDNST